MKYLLKLMLAANLAAATIVSTAEATQREGSLAQPAVSISGNSGGNIAVFALNVAQYLNDGTLVKFNGRCDSACTLFLGLPPQQLCITQGAFFRFHSPHSVSAHSAHIAQDYMMGKYPRWVKSWIDHNNGLSHNLITMEYGYASKFIQSCESLASR